MALHLKLKPHPLSTSSPFLSLPRFSSSSSSSPTSSSPPPQDPNSGADNEPSPPPPPPPPPSFSSYFSDIKERLKSPPPPPRRIPTNPSPPPSFSSSSPSQASSPTSLDEIRKHLASFRRSSPSPSSSVPTISFQDLLKNNVLTNPPNATPGGGAGSGEEHRLSFDSIRESLRQFRPSPNEHSPPRAAPFSLKSLQESLRSRVAESDSLPESIFGKEKKDDGDGAGKAMRTEFVKMYSYEELGEKLRRLRPEDAGTGGKDWFSLEELNERLVKLRELEEKETESKLGGVSFRDLRESLVRLKEADASKKANMQRLSILANIGGQATPTFLLKPPQEQLLERYFHPDHMSSAEKMKLELQRVRDEFKMSESDCGSARVQVAQLTTKIKHLSTALHKKDKHSRKGLQEMVQRRKKLLKYLRRTDWDSYCLVLSKLGLRDVPEYKAPDYKIKS
ncbi:uncharacterized protein [Typha angustifolia]|uniref:uncharacterized protein n=1 Tax=Typha angustifolia TaxID=59011 RepID=UPI003C2E7A26